jgi:uncharacterized RDD family membrane protein YckC
MPNLRGQYAGFASRFLAFSIDILILAFALAIGTILLDQIINLANVITEALFGRTLLNDSATIFKSLIVLVTVYGTYFLFFWTVIGTTIGGLIIGLRIVTREGRKPSLRRTAIRFFMEFALLPVLFIGSLWIFINPRRQAWYDKVAGTYVIYNWDARPEERFMKAGLKYTLPGKKNGQ